MRVPKTATAYASDLGFHLKNAAECAARVERSAAPADALDLAKRIRQGAQAQRVLTSQLQEALRATD